MMKRMELQEVESTHFVPSSAVQSVLRPIHVLDCGQAALDELSLLCLDWEHEELPLDQWFHGQRERYGSDLISFVAVKFGVVSSLQSAGAQTVMRPLAIAERLLTRYEEDPADFKTSFEAVLEEEAAAFSAAGDLDLEALELMARQELEELSALSGNPVLNELLNFVADLNEIFQGRPYLFSYLEMRYSDYFRFNRIHPHYLAVQMCLDYLTHREEYQIGILTDYERIVSRGAEPTSTLLQ